MHAVVGVTRLMRPHTNDQGGIFSIRLRDEKPDTHKRKFIYNFTISPSLAKPVFYWGNSRIHYATSLTRYVMFSGIPAQDTRAMGRLADFVFVGSMAIPALRIWRMLF